MAAISERLQALRDAKEPRARHARPMVNAALSIAVILIEAWDVTDQRKALIH